MEDEVIKTRDYTGVSTHDIVVEMLKENTGRGICDSGDAYGRNFQRNALKEFPDRPSVTCGFSVWRKEGETGPGQPEINPTISLYHWMTNCLEFDPEMQAKLDLYAATDGEDMSWLQLQEEFADHEREVYNHEREPNTINTYNDPDRWDCGQVLQYTELYIEDKYEPSHLIVSVHGGCDVRGGYTAPKCFKLTEEYYRCLELASVRGLHAGEMNWYYSGGCWTDCDTECYIPDVLELPCYDIDWFEDDERVSEIQARLAGIPAQRQELANTNLNAKQIEQANQQLDNAKTNLEQELFEGILQLLAQGGEPFTVISNNEMFLVEPEEFIDEPTVTKVEVFHDF